METAGGVMKIVQFQVTAHELLVLTEEGKLWFRTDPDEAWKQIRLTEDIK